MKRGMVYIVSGPSGSGKNTVLQALAARDSRVALAITATTRAPRCGEADGRDYYFLSEEEFRRRISVDGFVEWAEVHGRLYGTPRAELMQLLNSGKDVILQIDVQGMRNVRKSGLNPVTVFLAPPSMEELESRLRRRATESAEQLAVRLENARAEMNAQGEYDYVVVNANIDDAASQLQAILDAKRG